METSHPGTLLGMVKYNSFSLSLKKMKAMEMVWNTPSLKNIPWEVVKWSSYPIEFLFKN